jgi:hypothetical protein
MSDGRVVGAQNVYKGKFDGSTFFTVDNLRYKYSPLTCFEERGGWRYPAFNRRFYKQSPDADNTEWSVTGDIERILFLNEKENEELNYFQSTDFNAGIMYSSIEKVAGQVLNTKYKYPSENIIPSEIVIPAVQLIPKTPVAKEEEIIKATVEAVVRHFEAVYSKCLTLDIHTWKRDKQYFRFYYTVAKKEVAKKEVPKEMTVAEIEAALGYKVKIVGDKV